MTVISPERVAVAQTEDRSLPWIGHGENITQVDGLMTAQEVIDAAGLGWTTRKVSLMTQEHVPVPGKFAVVREDNGFPLGVVGEKYVEVWNEDAFDFANGIVASDGNQFVAGGQVDDGRQVFLVIDLGAVEPITIEGDPGFKTYLIIRTSHDGSCALSGMVTPVRLRCRNMLNLAISQAISRFSIRHSGNIESKMTAARNALGISVDYMRRFEIVANSLIDTKVSDDRAEAIFRDAFSMKDSIEEKGEDSDRYVNHAATRTFDRYIDAPDLAHIRGTGWGVVNAVAEFIDHDRTYGKGADRNALDVKTTSVLWGQGANILNRTLALVDPVLADRRVARQADKFRNRVEVVA